MKAPKPVMKDERITMGIDLFRVYGFGYNPKP